jgi:hypothetical protein
MAANHMSLCLAVSYGPVRQACKMQRGRAPGRGQGGVASRIPGVAVVVAVGSALLDRGRRSSYAVDRPFFLSRQAVVDAFRCTV